MTVGLGSEDLARLRAVFGIGWIEAVGGVGRSRTALPTKARPKRAGDGAFPGDIEGRLRRGVEAGQASLALWDAWPALQAFADHDPDLLASIIGLASHAGAAEATGARVEGESVAFAVAGSGQISDRFRAWVGDPADSVDCRELVRAAEASGQAAGRIRTLDNGVVAALAIARGSVSPWEGFVDRHGAASAGKGVLLVVFAPSRSKALIGRAADSLGLSPLQRRMAMAMLEEASVDAAAVSLGIGRETARDALEGAVRKAGVRGASELVARLISLSCNLAELPSADRALAGAALGLSRAEAGVAERIADGDTAAQAARRLGLSAGTVKAYRRSIFERLDINRSRDLRRLIIEAGELDRLSRLSEIDLEAASTGEQRIFTDAAGRTVACMDYGPRSGRPLLLMHGYSTGRLAPPPLLRALAARGRRVIIPQRPGFGMTSPAAADYLATAVADLILILDRLTCPTAAMLARDGGAAVGLAFGVACPARLEAGVLLNPRAPRGIVRRKRTPLTAVSVMLLRHPTLIEPLYRLLMRQSSQPVVVGMFRRAFAAVEADRACFEHPNTLAHLVADQMGLVGRTIRGPIAEQHLYSDGWAIPGLDGGPGWRLAFSGHYYAPGDEIAWVQVASGAPLILLDAGALVQFTHADAIAALFET